MSLECSPQAPGLSVVPKQSMVGGGKVGGKIHLTGYLDVMIPD